MFSSTASNIASSSTDAILAIDVLKGSDPFRCRSFNTNPGAVPAGISTGVVDVVVEVVVLVLVIVLGAGVGAGVGTAVGVTTSSSSLPLLPLPLPLSWPSSSLPLMISSTSPLPSVASMNLTTAVFWYPFFVGSSNETMPGMLPSSRRFR